MGPKNELRTTLLINEDCDHLIRNDGTQVEVDELQGKIVCLYFAANSSESFVNSPAESCQRFTTILINVYNELKRRGEDFEVVFVSWDVDETSFEDHHKNMPWLALPYWDSEAKDELARALHVRYLPSLAVFNKQGKLWNYDAFKLVLDHGPDAFTMENMAMSSALERLLGPTTLYKQEIKEVEVSEVRGKTIGLFFSAQSSRRARSFTHKLIAVYNELKENGVDFEIIFISNDHDYESFKSYYNTMPWLAMQFSDIRSKWNLINHFNVQEIPHLVILDPFGRVLTTQGCSLILQYGSQAFPFTSAHTEDIEEAQNEIGMLSREVEHPSHATHVCKECSYILHQRKLENGSAHANKTVGSEVKKMVLQSVIGGIATVVVGMISFCCSRWGRDY